MLAAAALWGWLRPVAREPLTQFSVALRKSEELQPPPTGGGGRIAISPDGRMLAFAGPGQGSSQLWLRRFDQLASTPIAGTEGGYSPFFSPDGRKVGFIKSGNTLRVASLDPELWPLLERGLLHEDLAASGFGLDPGIVPARPKQDRKQKPAAKTGAKTAAPAPPPKPDRKAAEQRRREARERLREAKAALAEVETRARELARELERARAEVERAQQRLDRA